MGARVLLVTANAALAIKAVQALRKDTDRIDVATTALGSALRHSRFVTRVETYAKDQFFEGIADMHRRFGYAAIMPVEVESVALCHELSLTRPDLPIAPTSDRETLDILDNKDRFCVAAAAAGVRVPPSALAADDVELARTARSLGFPVMIKSLYAESGHGVAFADNEDAARTIAAERFGGRFPFQVQKYVAGRVGGLNVAVKSGEIVLSAQYVKHGDSEIEFVEDFIDMDALRSMLQEIKFSGIANFDFIISDIDRSVWFIECNPRVWYNVQSDRIFGYDFMSVLAGIGRARPLKSCRGRYVFPKGVLERLFRNPAGFSRISRQSYHGLFPVLTDPMFHWAMSRR